MRFKGQIPLQGGFVHMCVGGGGGGWGGVVGVWVSVFLQGLFIDLSRVY